MQPGKPSRTALGAARHRAAHQILEQGCIFTDPLAIRILGGDAESIAREAGEHPARRPMRIFIAARTRFAEDTLAAAVEQGVRQIVILGAGLDTFAYRTTLGERAHIFEVDHPDTQAWKRQLLVDAAIDLPPWLTFAPIDFEKDTLPAGLAAAGFDPRHQSFFTWLGVVPYLTEEAIWATLGFIAGLPNGAHVVFDYADLPVSWSPEMRTALDPVNARLAAIGEAWRSHFDPIQLRDKLLRIGFSEIEDFGPAEIAARHFPDRRARDRDKGGHILRAATRPRGAPKAPVRR